MCRPESTVMTVASRIRTLMVALRPPVQEARDGRGEPRLGDSSPAAPTCTPPGSHALWETRFGLARRGPLGGRVHRVQRLTACHEQAVSLGAAETDVADDLGDSDASDQLPFGRPDEDATVPHRPTGVARGPHVAVDITADAIRPALDAVDHAVGEELLVGELVVAADIEDVD